MEGKNVYVVVDEYGSLWPFIAEDYEDALSQYRDCQDAEIEGIFVYGSEKVGLR
ncbi:hypothetical protein PBI_EQUEMIOH13_77 [Mycobacterium phage Equemioh13]|uniref:hypothetical protein n=1 Tax=Mycobacterium phage Equemioh13 TaxID=1555201 RepID=UPI00051AA74F|nr:hypothetical protein AVT12_gp29 [Mycobacterium phage Equemioh13]AIT13393.1 hypothetical protein PBI_EQUEMIOH13_77 [Mycobacterium phage Equemioh13]AOZ64020.1 hypothetical protein SEA_BAEHEXIC_76 [Mycobacterium phage Baehexic]ATN92306.1 hypothetical protein SEA_UPDAWG_78 [Mycobacterium phage Updawg]QDM57279.1 hypothetical protein SEA_WIDEWALE_78 [Mycobacterium phage WideWale]